MGRGVNPREGKICPSQKSAVCHYFVRQTVRFRKVSLLLGLEETAEGLPETMITMENRSDAVRRLAAAQKSARGAGAYSRWVNRPVGRQLAALAYVWGWTPNQVTALSAVCSAAGILLLALVSPGIWMAIGVAVLLALGYALDSADGQLSRLRGGGSAGGEWLDHVVDAVKVSSLHAAVLVSWYRFFDLPSEAMLLIPLVYGVVAASSYFALTLTDQLRRVAAAKAGEAAVATPLVNPGEHAPVLRSLLVLPNDYGLLCVAMVLLAVPAAFVVVYSLLLVANLGYFLLGCAKWYREMSGL